MTHSKFDINDYCKKIKDLLLLEFGEKVCYIGLQGSYLRGEATENSDIDIVVILDTLTVEDMDLYRNILEKAGDSDRACGFICSRTDMQNWNALEICQLKYTTKDLYGVLEDFLPKWTIEDEVNYIKMSLNNLYHALCHGYIHGNLDTRTDSILPLYKSAFFILQNTYFLETYRSSEKETEFVLSKVDLMERLHGEDKFILETLISLIEGREVDYDDQFKLLFSWCQNRMERL